MQAGEPLMDGPIDPHDILRVRGEKELQRYLVDEIQEVYRLQGVNINDKHIEVIVAADDALGEGRGGRRQRVPDRRGGGPLPLHAPRTTAWRRRARSPPAATRCCSASPRPRSRTDSFISAASFQETTRVLTEAAISGKVDHLRGLKENVIMGRLIPAGTGMEFYRQDPDPRGGHRADGRGGPRGRVRAEYLVEPEHIREGVTEA